MAPPVIRSSTAAPLPPASPLCGLDAALLRQWLEAVFADFYNGVFDASFGKDGDRQAEGLELLRQARSQQAAIVIEAAADLAMLLNEPGAAGVVVPISAARSADSARARLWQRRLQDAFLRRCAGLPLGPAERTRLEVAFERQLLSRLEQVAAGTPATAAQAAPEPMIAPTPAPRSAAAVVPPEQIERLVSRFRAGGLKLMLEDGEAGGGPDAPVASSAPADTTSPRGSANAATAGVANASGSTPAQVPRSTPRRAALLLVLLAACALLAEPPALSMLLTAIRPSGDAGTPAAVQMAPVLAQRAVEPGPAPPREGPLAAGDPLAPPVLPASIETTSPGALDTPAVVSAETPRNSARVIAPPVDDSAAADSVPGIAPAIVSAAPAVVAAASAPALADAPRDVRLLSQVAYLLQRGDKALTELRLTEPFADSAAANYLAVLAIEPANAAAKQGLTRVVERYSALVRAAVARGDTAQAELLLGRARSVLPHVPQLQELEKIAPQP
jgi:hypothetical protein